MRREHPSQRTSPRLQGFDYSEPRCYFVTICTLHRRNVFIDSPLNRALLTLLVNHARRERVMLHAYCLMPDHIHLLAEMPGDGLSLTDWVGRFKGLSTRLAWRTGLPGKLWQGRFYDHVLRQEESIERVAEYIVHNPVRKGMVETWEEYRWSGLGIPDPNL